MHPPLGGRSYELATNRAMRRPICWPLSSWRKWPAPATISGSRRPGCARRSARPRAARRSGRSPRRARAPASPSGASAREPPCARAGRGGPARSGRGRGRPGSPLSTPAPATGRCRRRRPPRSSAARPRCATSRPGTTSSPSRRSQSRKRSHSSDGGRPPPMPVFMITSCATRSGARPRAAGRPGRPSPARRRSRRAGRAPPPSLRDRADVEVVGVVLDAERLVRAAEPEVVGRDRARRRRQLRDDRPVEVRPRRLPVQEQDGGAGALVEVVQAQAVLLDVVRLEGVAG